MLTVIIVFTVGMLVVLIPNSQLWAPVLSSLYYCESRHLLQPALQGDTVAYKQVSDIQCQESCWIVSSWEREEKSSLLAYATFTCDTSSHQMLIHLWPVNKTQAKKYHIHIPQRDLYFISIGIPWNAVLFV